MDFFTWFMLLKKCLVHDKHKNNSRRTQKVEKLCCIPSTTSYCTLITGTTCLNVDVIYR